MRTTLLLCLVAALTGCHHRASVGAGATISGPGMNPKREASLMELAAREIPCNEPLTGAFVESIESNAHIYRVDGCGRTFSVFLHCIAGVCNWRETPERRASVDLQCPVEQVQRRWLGNGNWMMAGCGREIGYHYINGRLVTNTYVAPTGQPLPPPPANQPLPPPPPPAR